MMQLFLHRKFAKKDYTIGKLYVDGDFFCHTLEPPVRNYAGGEKKVVGHSAVPAGKYQIIYLSSYRFGRLMPYLKDVPNFTGVMIHTGNTVRDTKGCILVGLNTVVGGLTASRETFATLDNLLRDAKQRGEKIYITIIE